LANTGCYCFKNGIILKSYCEKIIIENIREKNEFYTSCIIKEMIKDRHIFEANIIQKWDFDCVGTPYQLKMYVINNDSNVSPKRICFDLDNTLVTYPEVKGDYTSVRPIFKNIILLRKLKNAGNTIIIYTARRMKTYDGNVGKIMQNVGKITLDTLEKFNIPYDELYFGKPHADFYIDDLAINAYEQLDKSLGFYEKFIPERSFNKIEIIDGYSTETLPSGNVGGEELATVLYGSRVKVDREFIKKTTTIQNGLDGEIYFYKNIPKHKSHLFTEFIEEVTNGFIIKRINGITISQYYTTEILTDGILLKILNSLKELHNCCTVDDHSLNIYLNYTVKITERFNHFDYSIFKDHKKVYDRIMEFCIHYEKNGNGIIGVIHGDPVFTNIIITEDESIKFIDMRGKLGNSLTIFGDIFYDYAKIYLSLIGYDEILLDEIVSNKYRTTLIAVFNAFIINNFTEAALQNIKMIANTLLFSLIPLHDVSKIHGFYGLIEL